MNRVRLIAAAATVTAAVAVPLTTAVPAEAASCMQFTHFQADANGRDVSDLPVTNAKLNAEYISMHNTCTKTIIMDGWQLRDADGHVYPFPATHLSGGHSITVHTGSGTNNPSTRYWGHKVSEGAGAYVWDNDGERARLWNGDALVDQCTYKPTTAGYVNC